MTETERYRDGQVEIEREEDSERARERRGGGRRDFSKGNKPNINFLK